MKVYVDKRIFHAFARLGLLKYRYSSFAAYGQSKLSNVLHANELARTIKVYKLLCNSSEIDYILTLKEFVQGTLLKIYWVLGNCISSTLLIAIMCDH